MSRPVFSNDKLKPKVPEAEFSQQSKDLIREMLRNQEEHREVQSKRLGRLRERISKM